MEKSEKNGLTIAILFGLLAIAFGWEITHDIIRAVSSGIVIFLVSIFSSSLRDTF